MSKKYRESISPNGKYQTSIEKVSIPEKGIETVSKIVSIEQKGIENVSEKYRAPKKVANKYRKSINPKEKYRESIEQVLIHKKGIGEKKTGASCTFFAS